MVLFLAILLDSFAGTQILTAILIYPMFWIAKLFAGKNLIWLMQTL
jgi:hypothetical protein